MAIDDLSSPLGQTPPRKARFRLPFTALQAVTAVLGLFLLTFLGFAIFGNDPMGGEPQVQASYDPAKLAGGEAKPELSETKTPQQQTTEPAGQKTVTIIDGSSGQRHETVIGGQAAATLSGEAAGGNTTSAMSGVNPSLLEKSRYGMIPAMSGALKPWRAYAAGTDLQRARAATMPVISIVIGGLGVGAAKTNEAILKLPSAVTLAFTPYGSNPEKLVEQARAQRHEVLLQIPMEPYEYPDNDPGPQTLLTSATPDQNIDRLSWHMSRFQAYVGIANFMGSRFVVNDNAMQPIMKEAAKRGLAYFDDGSAPRSVAGQIASTIGVPAATADVVIDQVPSAMEIDKALEKLEQIARQRGTAVGIASSLPISIERINNWAAHLDSRGILLAPLTTALMKSKSS